MSNITEMLNINWKSLLVTLVVIAFGITELVKLGESICKIYQKIKGKPSKVVKEITAPINERQDEEIIELRVKMLELGNNVGALKKAMMVAMWDRITHFGLNYVERGYISMSEADIFEKEIEAYKENGGNGHLKKFVPCVVDLPRTETLSNEDIEKIKNNEGERAKRMAVAEASLSSYYVEAQEEARI